MVLLHMEGKEKIAKVIAGKSVWQEGSLSFSCPKVEFSVKAGETAEGSFTVFGKTGSSLLGAAVTQDMHMHCQTYHFTENPSEIRYQFDSTGLDEGESARGEFKIMSNQGEYTIPYIVTVVPKIFETSLGQMKNLFHFANLAKTNWQEAVRIFYSPDFEKIITGNDRQYLNAYRALSVLPEKEQKVEEFLLCIRKKQRVEYIPDQDRIELVTSDDMMREVLRLTRNGWGYTRLWIETEGDFLQTEKSVLTDDDFLGNQCECAFLISHDALHAGYNMGKIRFFNEYVSIEIPVCVNHTHTMIGRRKRNRKRKMAEFFQCYLYYRMGKISRQDWLNRTENIVNSMDALGRRNPVQELMQAHIMLTRERYNEAQWLLQRADDLIRLASPSSDSGGRLMPEVWCYYLYLKTLVSDDEAYIRTALDEIRNVYQNDQTNWRVAWLLLYLDEEYSSLSRKWIFLEQQFEKGCRSPVWYLEAAMLVRKNHC